MDVKFKNHVCSFSPFLAATHTPLGRTSFSEGRRPSIVEMVNGGPLAGKGEGKYVTERERGKEEGGYTDT